MNEDASTEKTLALVDKACSFSFVGQSRFVLFRLEAPKSDVGQSHTSQRAQRDEHRWGRVWSSFVVCSCIKHLRWQLFVRLVSSISAAFLGSPDSTVHTVVCGICLQRHCTSWLDSHARSLIDSAVRSPAFAANLTWFWIEPVGANPSSSDRLRVGLQSQRCRVMVVFVCYV